MFIRTSLRTSAILCRTDVRRQAERRGYALDPYTGERIDRATGYPVVR